MEKHTRCFYVIVFLWKDALCIIYTVDLVHPDIYWKLNKVVSLWKKSYLSVQIREKNSPLLPNSLLLKMLINFDFTLISQLITKVGFTLWKPTTKQVPILPLSVVMTAPMTKEGYFKIYKNNLQLQGPWPNRSLLVPESSTYPQGTTGIIISAQRN